MFSMTLSTPGLRGGVHLVDDEDLGPAEVRLAGVVEQFVAGPVGIDDDDLEVGFVEGEVVVAAVPEDDVGFFFGFAEDGFVVDAGVDDDPGLDVGFVLLALLDRALVLGQVVVGGEPLDFLLGQVAVGHGMADGGHLAALGLEDAGRPCARSGSCRSPSGRRRRRRRACCS